MPKSKPNPIYPRWADPFFGMSSEYIQRAGGGDFKRGYDKILDRFIESWNARAKENRFLPPTSRAHGMEWVPDMTKVTAEALRIRKRKIAALKAEGAGNDEAP